MNREKGRSYEREVKDEESKRQRGRRIKMRCSKINKDQSQKKEGRGMTRGKGRNCKRHKEGQKMDGRKKEEQTGRRRRGKRIRDRTWTSSWNIWSVGFISFVADEDT